MLPVCVEGSGQARGRRSDMLAEPSPLLALAFARTTPLALNRSFRAKSHWASRRVAVSERSGCLASSRAPEMTTVPRGFGSMDAVYVRRRFERVALRGFLFMRIRPRSSAPSTRPPVELEAASMVRELFSRVRARSGVSMGRASRASSSAVVRNDHPWSVACTSLRPARRSGEERAMPGRASSRMSKAQPKAISSRSAEMSVTLKLRGKGAEKSTGDSSRRGPWSQPERRRVLPFWSTGVPPRMDVKAVRSSSALRRGLPSGGKAASMAARSVPASGGTRPGIRLDRADRDAGGSMQVR